MQLLVMLRFIYHLKLDNHEKSFYDFINNLYNYIDNDML